MLFSKFFRVGALALVVSVAPAVAQAESITQALAYAYSNNPQIASSFMSVRLARQAIRQAEGGHLPTIGAEASLSHTWSDVPGQTGPGDSLGLSYQQNLFDNGATSAAILAAEASYEAAVQGSRNTEQNVLLSAVQAYVEVSTNRRIVEIRRENAGFVQTQLQSARDRLELGEGTRLDVSQAEASLAQAQAALSSAINNLRISEANYQRWVGHAPGSLTGGYNYGKLVPGSVEAAMQAAETQHPALLAAGAQILAAQYRADEARAGFGPTLSLNGNVGTSGFTSDTGNLTSQATVSLRLSVPIYTPAKSPAIEQANISEIQSQLDAFATRDQVVEAVRQAWAGIQSATAQIESATAAVAASRIALQAVVDQNELGEATTLDVLDSRANLLTAEEGLVSAQSQRVIAGYSLVAAMGKLNAQALGLPVQPRTVEGEAVVPAAKAPADPWGNLR